MQMFKKVGIILALTVISVGITLSFFVLTDRSKSQIKQPSTGTQIEQQISAAVYIGEFLGAQDNSISFRHLSTNQQFNFKINNQTTIVKTQKNDSETASKVEDIPIGTKISVMFLGDIPGTIRKISW